MSVFPNIRDVGVKKRNDIEKDFVGNAKEKKEEVERM